MAKGKISTQRYKIYIFFRCYLKYLSGPGQRVSIMDCILYLPSGRNSDLPSMDRANRQFGIYHTSTTFGVFILMFASLSIFQPLCKLCTQGVWGCSIPNARGTVISLTCCFLTILPCRWQLWASSPVTSVCYSGNNMVGVRGLLPPLGLCNLDLFTFFSTFQPSNMI